VGVVTSPADYPVVLEELRGAGSLSDATRRRLARAAFAHTAAYDAAIVGWFDGKEVLPPTIHLTLERREILRYGENPHQAGARYRIGATWWDGATQHGGTALSYLNLFDADAAWRLVHELAADSAGGLAVAIVKHANPCGAAVAGDLETAYRRALDCDPTSAFGGIVAVGGAVTAFVAEAVAAGPQADVIVATSYEPEALDRLRAKRESTRILSAPPPEPITRQVRSLGSSVLVQDADRFHSEPATWKVVTRAVPTEAQWGDLVLAWRVCARTTSNAISVVTAGQAVGVGAGQQSRVVAAEIAVAKAGDRARGGAAAWACLMARRRPIDRVRSVVASAARDQRIAPDTGLWDQTHEAAADALDRERLARCLDRLSASQREAITLAFYCGHTYSQVADITGVPLGTVKGRIRDALSKLRDGMLSGE
jgi:phosphoribosylaminoimidazolecarboxamide formyltransferase/IMP cyclohydrolase